MPPLGDQFEIGHNVMRADDADRTTSAVNHVVGGAPGGGRAINIGEAGEFEIAPAESGSIDEGLRFVSDGERGDRKGESNGEKTSQHVMSMRFLRPVASLN